MQFVAMAIRQKEIAEELLREEEGTLTPAEVRYLKEVIRQGENAEKIMARYMEARGRALKEEKEKRDERQKCCREEWGGE